MSPKTGRTNTILLLFILLLDLIGFSLIFPLVPDLLDFYLEQARNSAVDQYLVSFSENLTEYLPEDRRGSSDLIILMGGILASLYSLLQFLASPFLGKLSDKIGRRPVLLITSLGLSVSYLIWFASGSFTLFIISRFLGGIMAGNIGVATAAMADMSDESGRTKSMGLIGAAFGVGFIIGPVIGGLLSLIDLTEYWDYSFIHPFSACAIGSFLLSFLSALLNLWKFKETLAFRGSEPVAQINQGRWIANPFKAFTKIADPGFKRTLLIQFIYIFIFSGFEFSVTFFYKLDFGLEPYQIGLVFLFIGFLIAAGQGGLVRVLSKYISEKKLAVAGILVVPVPLYLLALTAPYVSLSLLCLAPVSLGSSLVQPALTGLASLIAPSDKQGFALGLFRSAGSLARAVGPLSGAYLYWMFGIETAYFILAILMLMTFLLGLTLPDPRAKEYK